MSDKVQYDPSDLLFGAPAIADFLGPPWKPRAVYHAHERKSLPIGKTGNKLTASKSKLAAHFDHATNGQREVGHE